MKIPEKIEVVNIGLDRFIDAFEDTKTQYANYDWKPPQGDPELLAKLDRLKSSEKVKAANREAYERLNNSQPVLIDVKQAKDVIPQLKEKVIFHAGPPVKWENMCGPVKGAAMGACIYEGWAENIEEAKEMCAAGEIDFSPCHHHNAVGPMAGILSPSMYVWVVKNKTYGNEAYCSLNEGLGKVLRFGAYSDEVIERLKWMEKVLGPNLSKAVRATEDGINISNITAQALQMGDECHNRNVAATGLFLKQLVKLFLEVIDDKKLILELVNFISGNDHFYLNVSMAACKTTADSIAGLKNSTIVSVMARNGTEIGLRIAGSGDKWFTAEAGIPKGLFFSGFTQEDANPDLGDSTISEIAAIGGFAMAAAPAIVKFVGGTAQDAIKYTKEMASITHGPNRKFQIPQLNFMGTPTGLDILKVLDTGIAPFINTGIAHKNPGIGQVGAGLLRAPMSCFKDALNYMEVK
ncbi:MAG: DUF1116 domain-containing protein [Elusimicrobia bacterium]|jgi:hypothetical protein|nr:DUF1116 domain-containing protein [Elusimicrobiota bacterium]